MESALTTSPPSRRASATASAVLPVAVGPTTATTGGRVRGHARDPVGDQVADPERRGVAGAAGRDRPAPGERRTDRPPDRRPGGQQPLALGEVERGQGAGVPGGQGGRDRRRRTARPRRRGSPGALTRAPGGAVAHGEDADRTRAGPASSRGQVVRGRRRAGAGVARPRRAARRRRCAPSGSPPAAGPRPAGERRSPGRRRSRAGPRSPGPNRTPSGHAVAHDHDHLGPERQHPASTASRAGARGARRSPALAGPRPPAAAAAGDGQKATATGRRASRADGSAGTAVTAASVADATWDTAGRVEHGEPRRRGAAGLSADCGDEDATPRRPARRR